MALLQKVATDGASLGIVDWLCLAASPAFAIMAIVTHVSSPMHCSVVGTFPLDGMVFMYLLMSVFHFSPWLKLVFGRLSNKAPI